MMDGILQRLRARKLSQWVLAYLAAGWLCLEVLGFLRETFGWPQLVAQLGAVLLAVGFLAALVLAWYHGERGAQQVTAVELGMLAGILAIAAAAVGFVLTPGHAGSDAADAPGHRDGVERSSIAVLPFDDMSPAGDQQYFADGLAEELLNAFTRVPGLKVAARTSSFAFRNQQVQVDEIGRRLRVAHVLEGSVRTDGDRLRITAQLIQADDGYHVWSETYDRPATSVLAVQDEISRAIVATLRDRIPGIGDAPEAVQTRVDPRAYNSYLLGLYEWNRRTEVSLRRALQHFEAALGIEPDYAAAHSGLAKTWQLFAFWGMEPAVQVMPRARNAALRALEIDPGNSSALSALANVQFVFDWDFATAEQSFRRALELAPGDATAHQWFGEFLNENGRSEEGIAALRTAVALDPESLIIRTALGWELYYAGNYAAALPELEAVFARDSTFEVVHWALAELYLALRRDDDALASFQRYNRLSGRGDERVVDVLVRGIRDPSARAAALTEVARWPDDGDGSIYARPAWYARLGAIDSSLASLERSLQRRSIDVIYSRTEPGYAEVRRDPRFAALLRRYGMPINYLGAAAR
jgi:TolB-like protein